MNITELKELAEKASTGKWEHFILDKPLQEIPAYVKKCIDSSGGGEDFHFVIGTHPDGNPADICHVGNGVRSPQNAAFIAAANPAEILELIANLEDAQGEIRALRATKAGLSERVKELEKGLLRATDALDLLADKVDGTGFAESDEFNNALDEIDLGRALLEKKE